MSWNITGAVVINVTNNGGLNSVAGGLFLDPASTGAGGGGGGSTTATAAFVQTIQIGADGALSPTSLGTLPSYATLNTTANVYDWPSGQATWYGYPSFSFDLNLTDGKTHKITLYAIDFDTTSRAETITVADAVSGAALATQSISSFHSGVYLVFNVSGHVTITVTCTAGINAVIAGVYFN